MKPDDFANPSTTVSKPFANQQQEQEQQQKIPPRRGDEEDPKAEAYRLATDILGKNTGGIVSKLIKASSAAEALALIRQTVDLDDSAARRSYLMAIIRDREREPAEPNLLEAGEAW